jgi:hypothetical protein
MLVDSGASLHVSTSFCCSISSQASSKSSSHTRCQ